MSRSLKYSPRRRDRKIDFSGPGLFDMDIENDAPVVQDPEPAVLHPEQEKVKMDFELRAAAIKEPAQEPQPAKSEEIDVDMAAPTLYNEIVFVSFGSGSSGNCAYIGDADGGFLIDAGVDMTRTRDTLRRHGLDFDKVKGVILTHDHSDHVRYVYSLVRKNTHIGVYCTPKTLSGIMRRHSISRRLKDYHRPVFKEFAFKIGNFQITPFDVSHDGTDNAGYFIEHGSQTFAVATDLGAITDRVDYYMRRARHIMIEANYDAEMLRIGPYPMHLKSRIAAANGHLDNAVTARFLSQIATDGLSHVFLCHLSQDNNTPEKALDCVRQALTEAGIEKIGDGSGSLLSSEGTLQLVALPRFNASRFFTLR